MTGLSRRRSLRDASYHAAAKLSRGRGYVNPRSDPEGAEVDHLPDGLKGRRYDEPSGNGEEGAEV